MIGQQIKVDVSAIPPVPAVLSKLIQLGAQADVGVDEIVDVLALDPGLTARVIAACRSPIYARGNPPTTIREAVLRIGLREINRLAMAITLAAFSSRPIHAYRRPARYYWERSVTTALIMDEISASDGRGYIAGLMHLVGVWVLNGMASPGQAPIDANGLSAQASIENDRFGCAYPEAGAVALREWGFDELVYNAVAAQLDPKIADGHPHETLSRRLAVAICATDLQVGMPSRIPPGLAAKVTDDDLANLVAGVAERIDAITNLFDSAD